jgi:sarcosine oxidase subunit alpha
MNVAGPRSRDILQPLIDTSLDDEAFPYMGARECLVADVPCRVSRVGFVSALGYEIHPRADGAAQVWDAIMEAGREHGIRAFGVEAQRLLRLEKGHLIIGRDTDGLTSPYEAECGWAVRMQKPFFVGKRSLAVLQARDQERQLVGFVLDKDYQGPVPKDCQLVVDGPRILGRVTSALHSGTAGRVIGLAFVPPTMAEEGTKITIKTDGGRLITGTVTKPPFYDTEKDDA